MLTVKRQNFQNVPSWAIYYGETFLAYSMTRLGAERAKKELQASIKVQNKRMSQAEIDSRPLDQEPEGTMRKFIWRAVRVG